jgi:hypothetical protein
MLHIFSGENQSNVRIEAKKFVKNFLTENVDCLFNEVDSSVLLNWNELSLSKNLFGGGSITFFDLTDSTKGDIDDFFGNVKTLADSENVFVVSLSKDCFDKEKIKNVVFHIVKSDLKKKEVTNVFALSDAIGRKDKKNSWLIYRKLIEEGFEPEEIHGTIFWQIKSLAIADVSKDAIEAKMKPFVFSKSKGFLKNFKEGEIQNWLSKLVEIYHKSHRGEYALENALEVFLLGI